MSKIYLGVIPFHWWYAPTSTLTVAVPVGQTANLDVCSYGLGKENLDNYGLKLFLGKLAPTMLESCPNTIHWDVVPQQQKHAQMLNCLILKRASENAVST